MRSSSSRWRVDSAFVAAALTLTACAAHAPRRDAARGAPVDTSVERLADGAARAEVARHAAERHPGFSLAFVEFDDQGRLWNREQLDLLDGTLADEARQADDRGVGVVVFVHGWKHDAQVCDPFVACFRALLEQIARENAAAARLAGTRPPRLVGVYCGWRGRSVTVPIVDTFTFWGRKRTAERIGAGELVEVLAHLDGFVKREREEGRFAALTIVGHSFGGTTVYAALSNVLKTRLVEAYERRGRVPVDENLVTGFGDLVVLVNPAFEASAYAPLHDLVEAIGACSPRQQPILVIVGSETDFPNRVWFRLGRKIDVLTQRAGPRSSRALLTTAVGYYDPFTTHRLEAVAPVSAGSAQMHMEGCACRLPLGDLPPEEEHRLAEFLRTRRFAGIQARQEECAAGVTLGSVRLTCAAGVSPSRPVWSVRASNEVVHGHAGFYTRPFLDFIRYMILDSLARGKTERERR